MKKQMKLDYGQLTLLQEYIDLSIDHTLAVKELKRKMAGKNMSSASSTFDRKGKIKKIYYVELLTREERMELEIDMNEIIKLIEIDRENNTKQ